MLTIQTFSSVRIRGGRPLPRLGERLLERILVALLYLLSLSGNAGISRSASSQELPEEDLFPRSHSSKPDALLLRFSSQEPLLKAIAQEQLLLLYRGRVSFLPSFPCSSTPFLHLPLSHKSLHKFLIPPGPHLLFCPARTAFQGRVPNG